MRSVVCTVHCRYSYSRRFGEAVVLSDRADGLGFSMDSMVDLSLNDRKIVVGIDFGTTYSGVAWAETRRVGVTSLEMQKNLRPNRSIGGPSVCN